MTVRRCVAIALLIVAGTFTCDAQKVPLPSFHVANFDGTKASSSDLKFDGRWILLYVQTNCRSCNQALTQLKLATIAPAAQDSNATPQIDLARGLVIIVSGDDLAAAKDFASAFPWLKAANWYIDSSHEATQALNLHGAPLFFGMERSTIEWKFSGLTANPGAFNETLLKWMRSTPSETPKDTQGLK